MEYTVSYELHHQHYSKNVQLDDLHEVISLMDELRAEGAIYVTFGKPVPPQRKRSR